MESEILAKAAEPPPQALDRPAVLTELSRVRGIHGKAQWAQAFADALLDAYTEVGEVQCPGVSVHLTGRRARKRLGYYDVSMRSIHVNDASLSEYGLKSTLIHELGHHVQHTCPIQEGAYRALGPGKSHGKEFRICHWRLRQLAYAGGVLAPLGQLDEELGRAAQKVCGLRRRNGQQILQAGKQLVAGRERCRAIQESFEVFLQDCVAIHRTTAYDYIRAYEMQLPPKLNFTTMRFLMRLRDKDKRNAATEEALDGIPLEILRLRYAETKAGGLPESELAALLREKGELEVRLVRIEARLEELGYVERRRAARMRP